MAIAVDDALLNGESVDFVGFKLGSGLDRPCAQSLAGIGESVLGEGFGDLG